jgi:hypothetical protein
MASVVVGGMALAAYFSVSRWGQTGNSCRPGYGSGDAWNKAYQSPSNWLEALYMFAEALRCANETACVSNRARLPCLNCQLKISSALNNVKVFRYSYKETFGKWRTGDLLLGLAYLARRDPGKTMETKIQGQLLDMNSMPAAEAKAQLVCHLLQCLPAFFHVFERMPWRVCPYFASQTGSTIPSWTSFPRVEVWNWEWMSVLCV